MNSSSGESLGLALVGGPMLSKSLIQFSADGWGLRLPSPGVCSLCGRAAVCDASVVELGLPL